MKKLKLLLFGLISLLILPGLVNAANGTIKVTSTNTVVVGNKVTVTVTLSSSTSIGSWQMNLNYDKNYLALTSTTSEAGGTIMSNSSSGTKSKKYTYTFKTLKKGSTKVSVNSYLVYAYADMSEMNITTSSKTINIITQEELEASYSKDNNLKSLTIDNYEISPKFSKEILEYSVTVPEGTKEVTVKALANDSKSTINGDGTIEVSEGLNNIDIVVRAENGSEKTYKLAINVIDQNPINVNINNEEYFVNKLRNNYACKELFTESIVKINDIEIPSCINEKINYTLVGLKNKSGVIEEFIYENGNYKKYVELNGTSIKLINEKYDGKIDGLIKTTLEINGVNYEVFKFNEKSKYSVIYALNIENGKKDLYVYDEVNKTFSGYDRELIDYLNEQNKIYLYVILAFGCGLFLSLICILLVNKSKKNLNKKLKEYKNEKLENGKEIESNKNKEKLENIKEKKEKNKN